MKIRIIYKDSVIVEGETLEEIKIETAQALDVQDWLREKCQIEVIEE